MWRVNPALPASLLDRMDSGLVPVEHLITGERSEPTPSAMSFLEADLDSAVQTLFVRAEQEQRSSYSKFFETEWPAEIQRLNPVAVVYFDSRSHPDGDGVIIVVERHRDWDAGLLFCRQRNSEWQGVHLNGQIMSAGPDFGFRRLRKDGAFWHWYRRSWAQNQQSQMQKIRQQ